jgi:hypothetical protein
MENEHVHPPEPGKKKGRTQVISIFVGVALFILGLSGILFPAFAGLHFSAVSSSIIAVAGGVLIYNGGFKDHSLNAFYCCLGFGLYFGILALLGFMLGDPGMPNIGYLRMDKSLFIIVPNVLELGRLDQILYGVLSIILLGGAVDWWRQNSLRNHTIGQQPRHSHHRPKQNQRRYAQTHR